MLVVEGLSNAQASLLYPNLNAETKRREKYIATFEKIVNGKILGSAENGNSATWRIPIEDKKGKKVVGAISLNNMKMRKIMEGMIPLLIDVVIVDERQQQWRTAVSHIRAAFALTRKHGEYSDNKIIQFQIEVDKFYRPWLELHGSNGSSNYIHLISSGYLAFYMEKYRSLWKYSQQSWEALNSLVKTFYFQRTQRDGISGYKGSGGKSKLESMGRWMQRRTLFLCGYTNDEIMNFNFGNKNQLVGRDNDNLVVELEDDSSEICSLSDEVLVTNEERLFRQPEELSIYTNNDDGVISQWT